jgi:uncharacterized protein
MSGSLGALASLHRYPVKSMMGETLNSAEITPRGLFGDRAYALCDSDTGKVVSAKNPRKWPNMFSCHAAYTSPPEAGSTLPPVRVALPDGRYALSSCADFAPTLSATLGRPVTLLAAAPQHPQLEEYWPDREGVSNAEVVTDENMPEGTFFDLAILHILTTSTLDRLRELNPRSRFEPRRFRPNLIIDTSGQEGFVENGWVNKVIGIGPEVRIRVTGACPRCVMTTLPQGDLPKDPQVLKTAALNNEGHVGAYASVVQGGTIHVGDKIMIT